MRSAKVCLWRSCRNWIGIVDLGGCTDARGVMIDTRHCYACIASVLVRHRYGYGTDLLPSVLMNAKTREATSLTQPFALFTLGLCFFRFFCFCSDLEPHTDQRASPQLPLVQARLPSRAHDPAYHCLLLSPPSSDSISYSAGPHRPHDIDGLDAPPLNSFPQSLNRLCRVLHSRWVSIRSR